MSVLNEFIKAIEIQQRKDDESHEEQIKLPIDERVAKGVTMNNLKVESEFYDHTPNQWCPYFCHILINLFIPQKSFVKTTSPSLEGGQVILSNGSNSFKMEIIVDTIDNFILAPNDFDGE